MSERTFADKKGGKNRLMVRLAVTGLINTLHINLKIEKKVIFAVPLDIMMI